MRRRVQKCKTIRIIRGETFVRKNWLSRRTLSYFIRPRLWKDMLISTDVPFLPRHRIRFLVFAAIVSFVADETTGNFRFVLGRTGDELSGVFALYTTSACKQQEYSKDRLTFIVIIFLLDFETVHYSARTTWRRLQAEASSLLYVHIWLTVFNKLRSRGLDSLYCVFRWFRFDWMSRRANIWNCKEKTIR